MKDHHKALFIAAALIGFGVCSAQAAHKDVKHCADDYRKFCHAWGLRNQGPGKLYAQARRQTDERVHCGVS